MRESIESKYDVFDKVVLRGGYGTAKPTAVEIVKVEVKTEGIHHYFAYLIEMPDKTRRWETEARLSPYGEGESE